VKKLCSIYILRILINSLRQNANFDNMATNRIFLDATLSPGKTVLLDSRATHHLRNVLRVRTGDEVVLFNGNSMEYTATLSVQGKNVSANIICEHQTPRESALQITLVQGISRGDHMDWTIQKAVELGVNIIRPVYCNRSVKIMDDKRATKKQQHWQGVIISACEQSGRCKLPTLDAPQSLDQHFATRDPSTLGLVLNPAATLPLKKALSPVDAIEVLIGPEGGLNEQEIGRANKAGYQSVTLGPRILRTETAGVAALSILQYELGDLD
jgi:16S rRNA (uracil1498-N3)-methyltransferase